MRAGLIASVGAAALALGACQVSSAPDNKGATAAASSDWPGFVNGFIEAGFKANPGFAVGQGRHEYDGVAVDLRPAALAAEGQRLSSALATAQAFPEASLTKKEQFERAYLIANARGSLFWASRDGADQYHCAGNAAAGAGEERFGAVQPDP